MNNDDLLEPKAAAAVLMHAPGTLANWRAARRGPPWYDIGGRVFYKRSELEAWVASRAVRPAVLRPASVGSLLAA